jgi:hypothetical protein
MTNLEFHIKNNDYFGTLATILSLINQKDQLQKEERTTLNKVINDLMHLQENYIIKKNERGNKKN